MSSTFPTSLDSITTSKTGSDSLTGHAALHDLTGDAVNKLERKVGIDRDRLVRYVDFVNGSDANVGYDIGRPMKTIQGAYDSLKTYVNATYTAVSSRMGVGRIYLMPGMQHDVVAGVTIDSMRPVEVEGFRGGEMDYYAGGSAATVMTSSSTATEMFKISHSNAVGHGCWFKDVHFMTQTANSALTKVIWTTSVDNFRVERCSFINGDGSTRNDNVTAIYQDTIAVGGGNDDSAWFRIRDNICTNMQFYRNVGTNHNRSIMDGNVVFYGGTNPMVHFTGDLTASTISGNNFEGVATAILINPTNSADKNVFVNNSGESATGANPFYDIVGGSNNCHFIGGYCDAANGDNGTWIRFGTGAWNNQIYGAYDTTGSVGNKQKIVDNSTSGANLIFHPDWGVPLRTFSTSTVADSQFNPTRPPNGTLALAPGTALTVSYVARRGSNNAAGAATTLAVTTSAVTVGNLLIVSATCAAGNQLLSVADNAGNTWTLDAATNDGSNVSAAVASTIVASAPTTVTLTFNASTTKMAATVDEFQNVLAVSPKDQTRTGSNTTSGAGALTTSALPSTVQAAELVVAAFGLRERPTGTFTSTDITAFALVGSDGGADSTSRSIGMGYKVVAVTGAYTASITANNSVSASYAMATYKAATPTSLWARRSGIWQKVT